MLVRPLHALAFLLLVAAPAAAAELPFHDCSGLVCLDVSIDGAKPRTVVLDTGDVDSYVTAPTAKALGWKPEPIVQDGKPIAGIRRGGKHTVDIGGTKLDATFLVFDAALLGDTPQPGDGILAYPIFKDRIVRVDWRRHVLDVSEVVHTTSALPGKLELVTFGKAGPPIVVGGPFTLNGKSVRAQIDTCFTGTLLVYDAALGSLGVPRGKAPKEFPYTDGGITLLATGPQHVAFHGGKALDAPIYTVGQGKNAVHQPDALFETTIGTALLQHAVLVLDFHSMTFSVDVAS